MVSRSRSVLLRRFTKFVAIVSLCVVTLTTKAIAPIILARGVQLILANETAVALPTAVSAGVSAVWTGVVTTLGAAVAYMAFKDAAGVNDVRVPVSGSTETSLPLPNAAPTAGTPQAMYQAQIQSCVGWGNTADEACDAAMGVLNSNHVSCAPAYANSWFPVNGSGCSEWGRADGGTLSVFAIQNTGCPMGYTNSNGTCVLQNARMAVKDNHCDYSRSGTYYSQESDVDCGGQVQGTTSSGVINIAGRDDLGNPVNYTVTGNSAGTLLQQQVQSTDAAGNSIVTTKQLQLNNAGEVVTNTQYSQMGNVQSGTGGVQQAGSVNLTTATGVVSPTMSGTGSGPQIELPTDYARDATVQTMNTKLDALTETITANDGTGAPTVDTSGHESSSWWDALLGSRLSAWRAFAVPAHTSECWRPTVDLTSFAPGWSWTLEAQCTIAEDIRSQASVVIGVMWVIIAVFIVLGA